MLEPSRLALAGLDQLSDLSGRIASWASPERAFLADLLRLASLKSGDRVLDVGCGTGDLLAAAATREPGALLVGLDPDEDALELASRKIFGTLRPAELHQGVAELLPFEDESFDVITATLFLGTLALGHRREVLAECVRVLRPGGRFLVADWAEEAGGIDALVAYPLRLIRALLSASTPPPTLAASIARAGLHPPELRGRYRTVLGVVELIEAYRPLGG